ncbi:MAG: ParA family protein [Gammaproteobacteria bacterium]|nr:ParA family protein [Gammaproteobacteria bacterium]
MEIWTVSNQKGGVGKTTTVVSLAGLLAQGGKRVLMVDMDPHGSLSCYFGLSPDDGYPSVYDLFERFHLKQPLSPENLLHQTGLGSLHLLPSTTALVTIEKKMGLKDGMGRVLQLALGEMKDNYDYVLVDTPPLLGVLLINALAASDKVLIPVQTEFLAMKGLERMMNTVHMLTRSLGKEVDYTIVPTMYDRRTHASTESLRLLRQQYEGTIWPAMIPIDTKFRDASQAGIPPSQFMPSARGVRAYRALLKHLIFRSPSVSKQAV